MDSHGRRYLPHELIEHILRRSSLWASTRLQLVCKTWAAAGRAATECHQTPWMFLYTVDPETWSTWGYMASIRRDGAFFHLKMFASGSFIGSCGGWLVFEEYSNCQPFLLNPFTMARVDLPPLYSRPERREGLFTTLYLCPSDAAAARGCCMVASYPGGLAVWKTGQDRWKWRRIAGWRNIRVGSIAAVDGKLYVLDREEGTAYAVDLVSSEMTPLGAPGLPPTGGSRGLRRLVESRGELLLVHCRRAELKGVYRLDAGKNEWVGLASLGKDRALFVGSSLVFGSPLSVAVERAAGCRGDCVYRLAAGTGVQWTEFDMAAGGVAEIKMETPAVAEMCRGVWVSPMLHAGMT